MTADVERVSSGTPGLDRVLNGGFVRGQTTVVNGGPGTGKTVLALQFLAAGDSGLYIGFEEREEDLRRNAAALGIDLSEVAVLDLSADGDRFFDGEEYTLFPSEEVEGEDLIGEIAAAIDEHAPDRLVVDPLSELRSLLPDDYRFRRNISSLVNEMKRREVTTLCTAQSGEGTDRDLQFLGDATVEIERTTDHRWLEVTKFRGSGFAGGRHTYRIHGGTGGQVYPKLAPGEHSRERERTRLGSGTAELDALLGGGIERGSVTVVSGPSGVGKTTIGSLFLEAAAADGVRAQGYLFEELRDDYLYRCDQLGMNVGERYEDGSLRLEEVESLQRSADELAHDVRVAVEEEGVELVMIDGIPGYRLGLRGDESAEELTRELHALCRYLKRMGVTVILIDEVRNVTGDLTATDQQISYLADNIVFLRYMEVDGEIAKAVGVLKKRFGDFEQSLRSLAIDEGGVRVGDRLTGMRGILTGIPERVDRD
ncbi:ATPase domain-containing protein [Halosegnis marinus]|uniref:non-specific serine/threonine protein kinase n=1 Tax=Halosegnis marinus TaxID=3034023 RepID=A0ABD5ZM21_9EURY|nr:ATPase domain-containing protein [Halosegnis sp. DT85]